MVRTQHFKQLLDQLNRMMDQMEQNPDQYPEKSRREILQYRMQVIQMITQGTKNHDHQNNQNHQEERTHSGGNLRLIK